MTTTYSTLSDLQGAILDLAGGDTNLAAAADAYGAELWAEGVRSSDDLPEDDTFFARLGELDEPATIAERVSALFDEDGHVWADAEGRDLEEVGKAVDPGRVQRTEDLAAGLVRYLYSDGSSIVAAESGWDLGYGEDCWCWQGDEHTCSKDEGAETYSVMISEEGDEGARWVEVAADEPLLAVAPALHEARSHGYAGVACRVEVYPVGTGTRLGAVALHSEDVPAWRP